MVDTAAAEFPAKSPYYYLSRGEQDEMRAPPAEAVVVVGSGPIRIGQGIEFDYSCVHAAWALRGRGPIAGRRQQQSGDGLDRLRHLRRARLRAAGCRRGRGGVPRNQRARRDARVRRTDRDQSRRRADAPRRDDRRQRSPLARHGRESRAVRRRALTLGRRASAGQSRAQLPRGACDRARARFPGARAPVVRAGRTRRWRSCTTKRSSRRTRSPRRRFLPDAPLLVDKYLRGLEVEVDAVFDGEDVLIPGIFEHVERAGIHSGDSISVYPVQ